MGGDGRSGRDVLLPEGVPPDVFRATMARWPSGVTVVTCDSDGEPVGMTASSFSSLSLDPPLVLVCVARTATAHDPLCDAAGFAVHVLSREQEDISRAFARPGPEKFADHPDVRGAFDVPLLPVGVARMTCALESTLGGGDHTIVVGRVLAAEHTDARPLLYADRGYHGLG